MAWLWAMKRWAIINGSVGTISFIAGAFLGGSLAAR